jgi:lipopolysaccharide/colanic/teichoic acid biosynthesis glycosyltransferase
VRSGAAYDVQKRLLDVVVAGIGLIALSPLLACIAIAVRVRMGSPVLFRQRRPGRGGVAFDLLKFRTMTDRRSPAGELLGDADRLTALGRLLRRTSLDELPELFNVLRGDMSLVGPRPLLLEYLDLYTPEQARRHDVRPGITGWAQVNGRNATTWDERFAHDLYYVEHRSMRLDVEILRRTVAQVLRGAGVSAPGKATMDRFTGSPDAAGGAAERP